MPTAGVIDIPRIKVADSDWRHFDHLVEVRITRGVGTSTAASLRVNDLDGAASGFSIGQKLEVSIDGDAGNEIVFSGTIVAIGLDFAGGRSQCVVDAFDASHKLGQRTVIKTHLDTTAADIVQQIAQVAGLSTDLASELSKFKYESIQQRGTPQRFLTSLCHAAGCEWYIEGSKLIVRRRNTTSPTVTLSGAENLLRFTARFSTIDQVNQVISRGWDAKTKKAVTATGTGSSTKTPSTASITEYTPDSASSATSWPRNVVSNDDAETVAAGIAHRMGASALSARGECTVAPKMMPGNMVAIENVSPSWNGNYYVTQVEHVFGDRQPFVTRFTIGALEPDSLVDMVGNTDQSSAARFTDGVTIGLVTNTDDPEHLNRVKLKLPYLDDNAETGWARLVQAGAGASRGWLTLPEVDDEVLVAFEHGDIRRPYVLGGLWNGSDKPPIDNSSNQLRDGGKITSRSFTSRLGHKLTFSDAGPDGDRIKLELGTKKVQVLIADTEVLISHKDRGKITIENDQASIIMSDSGDITLKGQKITIEAQQDLTLKGTNIKASSTANAELKAGATLELKASASAKLDGGGMTEVKGGMVKVN